MKTPIDSAASGAGATVALINGGTNFQMLDLWKITLNGGVVVRWHSGPVDIVSFTAAGGQSNVADGTYLAGPLISRGKISEKLGLEASTLEVAFDATSVDLINGTPLIPFAQARGFDGATVQLFRAFLPSWPTPNVAASITGLVIEFSGRADALKNISRAGFSMTVSSWMKLLRVNMGPDVFQGGCLNNHYDLSCGLAKISVGGLGASPPQNQWGGTVGASPTNRLFTLTGAAAAMADHYFDRGTITFTSGVNNGIKRTVQKYVGGVASFAFAFPAAPAPGDTFIASRGCLLTLVDCGAQRPSAEAARQFRGQPYTPPATQAAAA